MNFTLDKNQKFELDDNITVYHLCNGNTTDIEYQKIISICHDALLDPVAIKNCFELDSKKPSTLLFQFLNKNMNLIIIDTETDHAILGYSIFDDIVLCPRRVYVGKNLRNKRIVSNYIMIPLNQMFINLGIKYIAMTFNKTKTGIKHFRLYHDKSNLRRILTGEDYFKDFRPLSVDPIYMFHNQQFVIYRKLISESHIPDLTIEKFCRQIH